MFMVHCYWERSSEAKCFQGIMVWTNMCCMRHWNGQAWFGNGLYWTVPITILRITYETFDGHSRNLLKHLFSELFPKAYLYIISIKLVRRRSHFPHALYPSRDQGQILLTHWVLARHTCISKLAIVSSDSGLSLGRRHAVIWTDAGILLGRPKMHSKTSSGK